ncbi:MAG: PAS domain-containing sensor histidine kinase [Verrucomicrobiota bacterium]|jgi:PAS domain S-box-containing protein
MQSEQLKTSLKEINDHERLELPLNLFRALLDRSNDGIEVVDPKTLRLLDVNETTCNRLGYKREELLSMKLSDLYAHDASVVSWAKKMEEIRRSDFKIYECECKRKDGSSFPVEVNVCYIQLDRAYIVAIVRDNTKRKQEEEALKNSHDQLRALSARLLSVREEESKRVAREIHDGLGQALTGLNMDLIWIQQKLQKEKSPLLRPQFQRRIKTMKTLLQTTVRSVQQISTELRPAILDNLGLTAALEWQAEEFEAHTDIRCQWKPKPAPATLNRDQTTALFRIFKEILTNVARHARARSVKLKLVRNRDELILEVADNGRGFNKNKMQGYKSLGLLGMRERAALIGGRVEVDSAPGKGSKVTVIFPVIKSKKHRKLKAGSSDGKKIKNSHR